MINCFLKKKFKKTMAASGIILTVALVFLFVFFTPVSAQESAGDIIQGGLQQVEEPLGLPSGDIRTIVANIIRVALTVVGIVILILMIYAGFLWMTAGGASDKIDRAKKILINAAIGLAIVLSAYGIVTFVMRMLGVGTGAGGGGTQIGPGGGPPIVSGFGGVGALGQVIKDHYPARDQVDVPRNSRIVITFNRPVLADSFIEDTNGDGVYGNCSPDMQSWVNDCDRLKTLEEDGETVLDPNYIFIGETQNSESIAGGAILASRSVVNGVEGVYTITINPLTDMSDSSGGRLGSSTSKIAYTVRLGSSIRWDDPENGNPGIFQSTGLTFDFYSWNFSTDLKDDITPPYVKSVHPKQNSASPKNTVIQIDFSEAVDPVGLQGEFNDYGDYYGLSNGFVFLRSNDSLMPAGAFVLSNGYRTLEFISSDVCGKNACGNNIYCLPVCGKDGAVCDQDSYYLLLKAAETLNLDSFEAVPFTGVADLSGNAMDGNQNDSPDEIKGGDPIWPYPVDDDNYYWDFIIEDKIDATAPFVKAIGPGINAEWVSKQQAADMVFSKRIKADSMYSISLSEKDESGETTGVWVMPRAEYDEDSPDTKVWLYHPDLKEKSDYYVFAGSEVEDVNFNCFYPGKGPKESANSADGSMAGVCDEDHPENCCGARSVEGEDFCCNGTVDPSRDEWQSCFQYLNP